VPFNNAKCLRTNLLQGPKNRVVFEAIKAAKFRFWLVLFNSLQPFGLLSSLVFPLFVSLPVSFQSFERKEGLCENKKGTKWSWRDYAFFDAST
jgi:hypothetical protein